MINVDGVIYGNSRCDITGVDLNRRWKYTSKLMYPQIYEIKRKILGYKTTNKI
jgi:murein tripeptide amidase MpaA